jgi:hypothetical protein
MAWAKFLEIRSYCKIAVLILKKTANQNTVYNVKCSDCCRVWVQI